VHEGEGASNQAAPTRLETAAATAGVGARMARQEGALEDVPMAVSPFAGQHVGLAAASTLASWRFSRPRLALGLVGAEVFAPSFGGSLAAHMGPASSAAIAPAINVVRAFSMSTAVTLPLG
jgi:hypothetical protein